MMKAAGATTADQVVDHFAHRFLSVPLADKDRQVLVAFLQSKAMSRRRRCASCCISCSVFPDYQVG